MDPDDSPYSPNNPFPHSLLRTRQIIGDVDFVRYVTAPFGSLKAEAGKLEHRKGKVPV